MAHRTKDKRFKKDYSRKDIISYLKGVYKLIGKSPTFRDIINIPGPSPRTIVRRFGKWSIAIKQAGLRPHTFQLKRGERSFIRTNWKKLTDKEIADKLGVSYTVIRYYRMNYNLWKNRKLTARSTFRKEALRVYGNKCECCGIKLCEWHHIVPKSNNAEDWCILCPTCHAVITRKLVQVKNRNDITTKLKPLVENIYKDLNFLQRTTG